MNCSCFFPNNNKAIAQHFNIIILVLIANKTKTKLR